MEYLIHKMDSILNSKIDEYSIVYSGNGLTIQCFHLNKGTSIMESNDSSDYTEGEERTICYLVERGCLEFWLGEEKATVFQGGSITVMPKENFSVWALEDSVVYVIYNNVEPDIDNTPVELVEAVTKAELKDSYLKGHNYRVGKYSNLMLQIICPEKSGSLFYLAAAFHDVGKVVVPEEILNKTGKLTAEEFEEIKKHPVASYEILKDYFRALIITLYMCIL